MDIIALIVTPLPIEFEAVVECIGTSEGLNES